MDNSFDRRLGKLVARMKQSGMRGCVVPIIPDSAALLWATLADGLRKQKTSPLFRLCNRESQPGDGQGARPIYAGAVTRHGIFHA